MESSFRKLNDLSTVATSKNTATFINNIADATATAVTSIIYIYVCMYVQYIAMYYTVQTSHNLMVHVCSETTYMQICYYMVTITQTCRNLLLAYVQ